MKGRKLGFIVVVVMLLTACNPSTPTTTDYLIFGDFYGMCGGPSCVDYYKIEGGSLYEDQLSEYPGNNPAHHFISYTGVYHPAVLDLENWLPLNIYLEGNTIGMPDAYDQGGFYIEVHKNGNTQYWLIDRDTANIPPYLHAICDTMDNYLTALE